MCLGGLILGYAVASLQMYRFAAVELVPPAYRAKAISWVTAGGVVAGIIGPSLVRWTHDQWVPLYLATYAAWWACMSSSSPSCPSSGFRRCRKPRWPPPREVAGSRCRRRGRCG